MDTIDGETQEADQSGQTASKSISLHIHRTKHGYSATRRDRQERDSMGMFETGDTVEGSYTPSLGIVLDFKLVLRF